MSETEQSSKTEEATPRKLEKARSQGDVAKTMDLSSFATLAAGAAALAVTGGWLARKMASELLPFVERPHAIDLHGAGGVDIARHVIMAAAPALAIVLGATAICGVAAHLMQTGLIFSAEKMKPDLKKLSPIAGLKKIFGLDNLVNFLKSLVKVIVTGALGWWLLQPYIPQLAELAALDPLAMMPFAVDILKRLVFAVAALTLSIAGADWIWQKRRYLHRMKMTREEVKDDFKQVEGDPHVKARQKQIRFTRARQRMMAAVPDATVVVMNPTHYAVALKYDASETPAPMCVAKGLDSLALKIRAVAEEAGVPVIEDPPLARALYAAVEIDDMIPPAHYEAVAKIIGFILNRGRRAVAKPL
ncbi:flagellar biosynthesis protein FlhB [Phenylobacterium zucineum HLK1]|uniref:Flagellar biosynthetic protein FlhB n=1 Tax=Phenylobacterium zucineum (strain HLK1) TaxID=450851 RepID=B4RGY0_PHEZH|nr:flagellar biosynthesis protein FlhB [Phenylobacterium zucineum]ACG77346.1 flagellar biosynthesis protein FlhB [Phenylobacterium zucineum HLK1]